MKKTYEKPEIAFDDFTLSNTIAASCENYNNLPSLDQCGFVTEDGYRIFFQAECLDVRTLIVTLT